MLTRLKLQVATNGTALAAGCLIVGVLLLAGAGYVYATPGVEEQPPEEIDSFDIEVSLDDSAIVQQESLLYDRGETLQSKPVYFLNLTPELTLETAVDTSSDHDVTVTHELVLIEQAGRDGTEFWSRETTLASTQSTVTDGSQQTNASFDARDLSVRQAEIGSVIDAVSEPTAHLRLETTYETEPVAGEPYEGTLVVSSDINLVTNAVWFDADRTASDSGQRLVEQEPVTLSPNLMLVILLAVAGSGFIVAGGVVVSRSGKYDEHDLRIEMYNNEYSEWISKGELVVDPDRQYIYVNSLKDLVNIGIDADKRVIHDTELNAYVVVDSGLVYYYAREPTNIELWANVGNTGDDQS